MRASLSILVCGLAALTSVPVHAQNAQSVRLGEAALTFSAGSIRQEMPVDGVVNVITGDNQLAGNRMMIGWTGTDTLYLKLKNSNDAAVGDLYTVYRRERKVFHPLTKQYMGYIVNRLGVVQVIQLDPKVVGVRVVRSYAPISPGDPVMRFSPPSEEFMNTGQGGAGDVEAMVVELQADKHMSLVSQGNLVYLDKGQDDGLRTGDVLEVFRTGSGLPERMIGTVKILSTELHTSTAVIFKATARVLVGDRLRSTHAALVEAMPLEGGESDSTPALVQPVTTTNARSPLSPSTDSLDRNKVRIERSGRTTRINLDDLADQLEYESGEVKVKPAGVPILQQLTDYLKATAVLQHVRVEGHADNMEIGPTLKGQFPTNWELSKARAADIVRHLIEKGGMDSAKLSAVGYGASRPVASNATEDGRRKNRRIEVVIESPEETATAQPIATPASARPPVEPTRPAQLSRENVGVPADAVSAPATVGTPTALTSADASSSAVVSHSEKPEPSLSEGSELPSLPPGL
ncbi:MAG TPA: OmpA family protein [Nitrospira sp.]|nr:OmpA family protein [Nitrospira sp.]